MGFWRPTRVFLYTPLLSTIPNLCPYSYEWMHNHIHQWAYLCILRILYFAQLTSTKYTYVHVHNTYTHIWTSICTHPHPQAHTPISRHMYTRKLNIIIESQQLGSIPSSLVQVPSGSAHDLHICGYYLHDIFSGPYKKQEAMEDVDSVKWIFCLFDDYDDGPYAPRKG